MKTEGPLICSRERENQTRPTVSNLDNRKKLRRKWQSARNLDEVIALVKALKCFKVGTTLIVSKPCRVQAHSTHIPRQSRSAVDAHANTCVVRHVGKEEE